ncbi:MAG: MBL fold metallo-hydrolase [Rhodospirillaceae bacterium]
MITCDNYDIEILVTGFPGKSVCHGSLGWSTIVLLRGQGRVALIDTGGFGVRHMLQEQLAHHGLKPSDVTDLLLSHCHYDHSVNWPLFKDARIVIAETEMAWGLREPWGTSPVPEFYVDRLSGWPTLEMVGDGDEVLPHITARIAPGHTPGSLVYVLTNTKRDIVFTGDAAKNRAELISRAAGLSVDHEASAETIEMIWGLWRARDGSILIPGHDLPMTQTDGEIAYIGEREAAMLAWYGEDLEQTTIIRLEKPA